MSNKSFVCPLEGFPDDKERALEVVESYARQEKFSHKSSLHLRLLAEEFLGMLDGILEIQDGNFWLERGKDGYEIHLKAKALVPERAEAVLVQVSSTGVNEAYRGVLGKMKKALDIMMAAKEEHSAAALVDMGTEDDEYWGFTDTEDYSEWSYSSYKEESDVQKKAELWDELELSVLERLADDIVVSVRPDSVDIVVKAAF